MPRLTPLIMSFHIMQRHKSRMLFHVSHIELLFSRHSFSLAISKKGHRLVRPFFNICLHRVALNQKLTTTLKRADTHKAQLFLQ